MCLATDENSVSVCLAFGVWCQWNFRAVRILCMLFVFVRVHKEQSCHSSEVTGAVRAGRTILSQQTSSRFVPCVRVSVQSEANRTST